MKVSSIFPGKTKTSHLSLELPPRELLGGGNKKGSKSLLKAISKECLKKLSRESVRGGGRSRQDLKRSSRSREQLVFKCGSKAGGNSRSSLQGGSKEGLHKGPFT